MELRDTTNANRLIKLNSLGLLINLHIKHELSTAQNHLKFQLDPTKKIYKH